MIIPKRYLVFLKSQKLNTEMHEWNNSGDRQQNPDTHPARTDMFQEDCTRKQVAYQMFSSASHLTEIPCAENK